MISPECTHKVTLYKNNRLYLGKNIHISLKRSPKFEGKVMRVFRGIKEKGEM